MSSGWDPEGATQGALNQGVAAGQFGKKLRPRTARFSHIHLIFAAPIF
jgi:hypothetical protein